ncbi:glycosyltransferase family protein [Paenibacillus terreus]|uniref:Glycosyltransferase family protein n=1 Tax=Paenibacillus terreus TaxID=1387834 RepID=A0ABV5BA72_9BACL
MRVKTMTEEENSVCFITCVNDDVLYKVCQDHLRYLSVPSGVHTQVLAIRGASSLTSGYNQAIRLSRAKYKVYLHQDTYIMNRNFIHDLLELFKTHPQLGLVGLIGSGTVPDSGVWWESDQRFGRILENRNIYHYLTFDEAEAPFQSAAALDGLLMATQYDVPWREDIFDGWHYYDVSQCFEFKRRGYSVGIPPQAEPWVLHNCGVMERDLIFEYYRIKFLLEYGRNQEILNK